MNIVVTGGCGFLGTNVALHYHQLGDSVVCIDNNSKSPGNLVNRERLSRRGIPLAHVDIRNSNDVDVFFRDLGKCDAIFHLAAQVAFKQSVENPRKDFEINAVGTFNLLEALRLRSPRAAFVLASTNQVYGALPSHLFVEQSTRFDYKEPCLGIREDDRLDFLSPYGCSKGAADQYTLDYARIYGLQTAVARLGGIYGCYQYSYEDHGWVSYISEMVRTNQGFNRFGHGKQVRDVLFSSDIVLAFDSMLRRIDTIAGEAINIAGGRENSMSVVELLRLLEDLTGNKERSVVNPMRSGDKLVAYLDISKADRLLGWRPQVGKVEGVRRLLAWLDNPEAAEYS